jgi:hypothetical protein
MKTVYKVTGLTAYKGVQPGETFEADLAEDEERRALERGSIQVEGGRSTKAKTKKEDQADA